MTPNMKLTGRFLAAELWRYRVFCLELSVIAIMASLILIRFTPAEYTASAILAPQNASQSDMVGSGSALRALTALTGASGTDDRTISEFLKVIGQPVTGAQIENDKDAVAHIFMSRWDATRQAWIRQDTFIGLLKSAVRGVIGAAEPEPVNRFLIAEYIQEGLAVSKDRATGIVTVSYSNPDRDFAVRFLGMVISQGDHVMRVNLKRRAAANISHLRIQIESTQQTELRYSLIQLLQSQQQSYMMASSGDTYAFRYLQAPAAAQRPSWPAPVRIIGVSITLAFVLALGIILIVQITPANIFRRLRRGHSITGMLWNAVTL
jgi:hypothetical protein